MAGVYIHIPFCKQACHYCNFHFSTTLKLKADLVDALAREITLTPFFSNGAEEMIDTIYFGGGTPSLLSAAELKSLFDVLHVKFRVSPGAEITLEANPDDINKKNLSLWKEAGINRLSVGIQSFSDEELNWMNRAHTAAESLRCIDEIEEAGFGNFSIDLIYGSPLLSNESWKRTIDTVTKRNIPHVSCYALTVEPKTALDKMIALHRKEKTDPEKQAAQFLLLMEWMSAAGYEHYEISNFSLPGKRSQHNSSYWQGKLYYGFGPSAHSFDGTKRRWNVANNAAYIRSLTGQVIPFEEETLTVTQQLNEYIMTALRTAEGLDLQKVITLFGEKTGIELEKAAEKWQLQNKLTRHQNNILLTNEGKLFADGIAADLFF